MLYIGYPVDDTVPNAKMGGYRKLPTETCFWNEAPKNNVNLHSGKRLEGIQQELSGIIADLQDV